MKLDGAKELARERHWLKEIVCRYLSYKDREKTKEARQRTERETAKGCEHSPAEEASARVAKLTTVEQELGAGSHEW